MHDLAATFPDARTNRPSADVPANPAPAARRWLLLLAGVLLLAFLPLQASADGKYYGREASIPPHLPYQRAIIAFDGEREVLVVQSKFQATDDAPLGDLGWIVPVPAVPRVGTMTPDVAQRLFRDLDRQTLVEKIRISELLLLAALALILLSLIHSLVVTILLLFGGTRAGKIAWLTLALLTVLLVLLPEARSSLGGALLLLAIAASLIHSLVAVARFRAGDHRKFRPVGIGIAVVCVIAVAVVAIPQFSQYTSKGSVAILREETVGDLEIKVIRAADASDLAAWLKENRFRFDDADRAAFASLISRRWVFVTARPVAGKEDSVIGRRGMLAPLVLVFPTKQAVYPLALTATAGSPTQIDLFAFHNGRLDAGEALPMTYAGRRETPGIAELAGMVEPKSLLAGEKITENFVTRFHGRMSAEQMKDDLTLRPAADNSEYKWKLVW